MWNGIPNRPMESGWHVLGFLNWSETTREVWDDVPVYWNAGIKAWRHGGVDMPPEAMRGIAEAPTRYRFSITEQQDEIQNLQADVRQLEKELGDLEQKNEVLEQRVGAMDAPAVNWAPAEGTTLEEMREALEGGELYREGDARLVWVNEGDFLRVAAPLPLARAFAPDMVR